MTDAPKKKVLFVLPNLGSGGAEKVLITIMNNLDREKFASEFLVFNESGEARKWITQEVPFHSFGRKPVKYCFFSLVKFLRKNKPDILFTTMVHINGLACVMKILFPKMKIIIREASTPMSLIYEYGFKGRMCGLVYRTLYPLADLVVSPAQMIVDQFERDLRIKGIKHKVIYNPVDIEKIYQTLHDGQDVILEHKKVVRFVCLARLAREKGLDILIEALAKARFEHDWILDIMGQGDQQEKLEGLIKKHNLQGNICMRGYHPKPWKIAALADCLLLPSLWEGMPNVVLESLACGVPAIALKTAGAIEEIAQACDEQDVFVADNMDDFIAAMRKVKPELKSTRKPSRLPDRFSLDHIVGLYQDCFS